MDWVLKSPQIHSVFATLGVSAPDGYHINEDCNATLETILHNIRTEDKNSRTYRRSISLGQNISKDFIPLLMHAKEDKTLELVIEVLLNLSIPLECLLSVDLTEKSDVGRHIVFELNMLLHACKLAFTDKIVTKIFIDYLKKNFEIGKGNKYSKEQRYSIINCLLLLRNILHIPEVLATTTSNGTPSLQNQILWNIFSQSIDKILIKLMTVPEAHYWGTTMAQIIALLYRDQHVSTLRKLLNIWLESSTSESSEDNESNTSPPERGTSQGSDDSSPMLTSDPTSDSSDTGGSGKSNDAKKETEKKDSGHEFVHPASVIKNLIAIRKIRKVKPSDVKDKDKKESSNTSSTDSSIRSKPTGKVTKPAMKSEVSDCGYGTQLETQGSVSTSSNEDDVPAAKTIVQEKPCINKQRPANVVKTGCTVQENKRKKLVKRGKSNIINVQGLTHKTPTDEDISNVLKEFTVDFLLKGYNSLVQTIHSQILTNMHMEFDISHFLWLITYFLKFCIQIELDLEHISSVLSVDIMSYLTAQGVYYCERSKLSIKLETKDLKPNMRRLHLVITAIKEFVQALEMFQKVSHVSDSDRVALADLQTNMCDTEELRFLFLLLLRHYNPKYYCKQYLQDLVVTNHLILLFLDKVMRQPGYKGPRGITDHFRQYANSEIMYKYGILLEDFGSNGQYVNDCIFTVMHHVGGELDRLVCLFQPIILKSFTEIWKADFELCDDWSDLVEYVINTVVKKPKLIPFLKNVHIEIDDDKVVVIKKEPEKVMKEEIKEAPKEVSAKDKPDKWTDAELSVLNWNYMQCSKNTNIIEDIVKMYKDEGSEKTKTSVIRKLYKHKIINKAEYDGYIKEHSDGSLSSQNTKESKEEEISKFCEQLSNDGKVKTLAWVQNTLLGICKVKVLIEKQKLELIQGADKYDISSFVLFKEKIGVAPLTSPVAYHCILQKRSIPLVPWNCEQASGCKDLKFLQLVHKLGFQMPVDTGNVFIRIPWNLSAAQLYDLASKILPIDIGKLPFTVEDIEESRASQSNSTLPDTVAGAKNILKQKEKDEKDSIVLDGVQNSNWLELVKQSKECKIISTSLKNQAVESIKEEPVEMISHSSPETPSSSELPVYTGSILDDELSDYDSSLSDTASVASDLTRMYVSDEEDRFDRIKVTLKSNPDRESGRHKRPRVC